MDHYKAIKWYEALYADFPDYDDEPYTWNTRAEVDFIESAIVGDRRKRVLDVGCGTGRHALELARRGYRVTGLDLSEAMLARASKRAATEGLTVQLVQADARAMGFERAFEVVIMLCEGGFSLVETDEMDRQILAGAARALIPGGVLILTAPSAAYMLAHAPESGEFDPQTLRETFRLRITASTGEPVTLECTQRYYTLAELTKLLGSLGFSRVRCFAVTEDGYDLGTTPTRDQFELGLIAEKPHGETDG